jgi:hypothetical protein
MGLANDSVGVISPSRFRFRPTAGVFDAVVFLSPDCWGLGLVKPGPAAELHIRDLSEDTNRLLRLNMV